MLHQLKKYVQGFFFVCLHSKMEVEGLDSTFLCYFHLCYFKCFTNVSTAVKWLNIIIFAQISKIKEEVFNLTKDIRQGCHVSRASPQESLNFVF